MHELLTNIVLVAPRVIGLAVIGSGLLALGWWASLLMESHDGWVFGHDNTDKVLADDERI